MNAPLNPKAVAAAAIASGLLCVAPQKLTTAQLLTLKAHAGRKSKRLRLSPEQANERRREIHLLRTAGYEPKEIARRVGISRSNVNNYLRA